MSLKKQISLQTLMWEKMVGSGGDSSYNGLASVP
jgi:hypothetical protein